jgi:hypothetical protein
MYIGLRVKYRLFLSDFSVTCIFSTYFRNMLKITHFKKVRPLGAQLFHADGQTHRRIDTTKFTVAVPSFVIASKDQYLLNLLSLANFKTAIYSQSRTVITNVRNIIYSIIYTNNKHQSFLQLLK